MVHDVEFNRLAHSARSRLAQLLSNEDDRALVYSGPSLGDFPVFKAVVVAVGVLTGAALMAAMPIEFAHDRLGRQQMAQLLAGVWLVTLLAGFSLSYRLFWKPPPWTWNKTLATGAWLIHVTRTRVVFAPVAQLGQASVVHRYRKGYRGSTVTFAAAGAPLSCSFDNREAPARFLSRLAEAQQVCMQAWEQGDRATLVSHDPFLDADRNGHYQQPAGGRLTEPSVTVVPNQVRALGWVVAVALATLIPGLYYLVLEQLL